MDTIRFREVIKQREETDDEWTFGVEQCWKKEIVFLHVVFENAGWDFARTTTI